MQTLSPSIDRIGAALRALRRAHGQVAESGDFGSSALGAQCLEAVIAQLAEAGVPPDDLQPLVDLYARLRQSMALAQGKGVPNRRKGQPPSDRLLARGAAVIDLLIKAGSEEGEAAQIVMRRLLTAGVPAPERGGDARGWKRLLECRTALMQKSASREAQLEYEAFARELEAIPAGERVSRVLGDELWDRRRNSR